MAARHRRRRRSTAETVGSSAGGGRAGATRDERLGDVGLVVLDEVHYLGE